MNTYIATGKKNTFKFTAPDSDVACWELQKLHLDQFLPKAKYTIVMVNEAGKHIDIGVYNCIGFDRNSFVDALGLETQRCTNEAKRFYDVVRSRGRYVVAYVGPNMVIGAGDGWEFPSTMQGIREAVKDVRKLHPQCDAIYVDIAFNGANSVLVLNSGEYDPMVSSGEVLLWKEQTCYEIMEELMDAQLA